MIYSQTSQYGECAILHTLFLNRPPGYFIDIGAADGIRYSNTLNLINRDWSGILVEPCHHFLETLLENYADHKKVNIYSGAVSDYNGSSKFHVWKEGGDSQISTIVEDQYESIKNSDWWKKEGSFTNEYDVDVITPVDLLNKFKAPKYIEFVDIDAEASEMAILDAWPWDEYEVELFCIEFSMGKEALNDYMTQKGYGLCFSTGGNNFYCKINKRPEIINNFKTNWEQIK